MHAIRKDFKGIAADKSLENPRTIGRNRNGRTNKYAFT
jgi:hypothetical protein